MILFYTKYMLKHLRILLLSSDLSRPFSNDKYSIFYVLIKGVTEDLIASFKQTENYGRKSVAICEKRGPKSVPVTPSDSQIRDRKECTPSALQGQGSH